MSIMIGIDPHKASHTAVAIDSFEFVLDELRIRSCSSQVTQLRQWAEGFRDERTWAVESAQGLGYLLAQQLIAAGETSGRGLVACSHGGAPGAPALFTRRYFEALRGLSGHRGARALLEAHRDDCSLVDEPLAVFDVDTPADLDRG